MLTLNRAAHQVVAPAWCPSSSGRYLRMYGTVRGTGYGYSLWEFQVFGT